MCKYVANVIKARDAFERRFGSLSRNSLEDKEAVIKKMRVSCPKLRKDVKRVLAGQPVSAFMRDRWQSVLGETNLFVPDNFDGMVTLTGEYDSFFPRSWYGNAVEQSGIVFASDAFGRIAERLNQLIRQDRHAADKLEAQGRGAIETMMRVCYLHTVGASRQSDLFKDNYDAFQACQRLLTTLELSRSHCAKEVADMLRPALENIRPFGSKPAYWAKLKRILNEEEAERLACRKSSSDRFVERHGNERYLSRVYDTRGKVFHLGERAVHALRELKKDAQTRMEAFIVDTNELASLIRLKAGHAMHVEIPDAVEAFLGKQGEFHPNEDAITTVIRGFATASGLKAFGDEGAITNQLYRLFRNGVQLTPAGSVREIMDMLKAKKKKPSLKVALATLKTAW